MAVGVWGRGEPPPEDVAAHGRVELPKIKKQCNKVFIIILGNFVTRYTKMRGHFWVVLVVLLWAV